jgi:tetratricopeptide (TPR) repeat protein
MDPVKRVWPLLLLLLAAPAARGARPWERNVTVQAVEGVPAPLPDPEAQVRFQEAFSRGRELLQLGQYTQARTALSEALNSWPDHSEALFLRARATLIVGYLNWNRLLIEEAIGDVRSAQRLDPGDRELQLFGELLDGLLKRMPAPKKSSPRP